MLPMDWRIALAGGFLALSVSPALAQQGPMGAFADTAVRDLIGANVIASDGTSVGEVERVVAQGESVMAVVGVGGFLGFGEHDVALPLVDFQQENDGLSLAAYTESDLRALVEWGGEGEALALNVTVSGTPIEDEAPAALEEAPLVVEEPSAITE